MVKAEDECERVAVASYQPVPPYINSEREASELNHTSASRNIPNSILPSQRRFVGQRLLSLCQDSDHPTLATDVTMPMSMPM